jgi:hypothetical protein
VKGDAIDLLQITKSGTWGVLGRKIIEIRPTYFVSEGGSRGDFKGSVVHSSDDFLLVLWGKEKNLTAYFVP